MTPERVWFVHPVQIGPTTHTATPEGIPWRMGWDGNQLIIGVDPIGDRPAVTVVVPAVNVRCIRMREPTPGRSERGDRRETQTGPSGPSGGVTKPGR